MKENLPVLIVVIVIVMAVLVFVIIRNRKDEKALEHDMDEVVSKPHKHPGEDEV